MVKEDRKKQPEFIKIDYLRFENKSELLSAINQQKGQNNMHSLATLHPSQRPQSLLTMNIIDEPDDSARPSSSRRNSARE